MRRILTVAASAEELGDATGFSRAVVGVGKVQSAVRTLEAVQTNRPDLVVCVGFAGSVADGLEIGDVVVGTSVCQYDVDLTAFKLKRCELPEGDGVNTLGFLPLWDNPCITGKRGIIGTADLFLTRSYLSSHRYISDELGILACDMESFSVAYAANRLSVPCMVIRVISDDSKGHRPKSFPAFVASYRQKIRSVLSIFSE